MMMTTVRVAAVLAAATLLMPGVRKAAAEQEPSVCPDDVLPDDSETDNCVAERDPDCDPEKDAPELKPGPRMPTGLLCSYTCNQTDLGFIYGTDCPNSGNVTKNTGPVMGTSAETNTCEPLGSGGWCYEGGEAPGIDTAKVLPDMRMMSMWLVAIAVDGVLKWPEFFGLTFLGLEAMTKYLTGGYNTVSDIPECPNIAGGAYDAERQFAYGTLVKEDRLRSWQVASMMPTGVSGGGVCYESKWGPYNDNVVANYAAQTIKFDYEERWFARSATLEQNPFATHGDGLYVRRGIDHANAACGEWHGDRIAAACEEILGPMRSSCETSDDHYFMGHCSPSFFNLHNAGVANRYNNHQRSEKTEYMCASKYSHCSNVSSNDGDYDGYPGYPGGGGGGGGGGGYPNYPGY